MTIENNVTIELKMNAHRQRKFDEVRVMHAEIVKDLVRWIQLNLDRPLSIRDIALKSGYSQWHIQRIFKSVTGETLADFVREQRLQNALVELKNGEDSIVDIAMKYQFNSHQSFATMFKRALSMSPSEYRRRVRS